MLVDGAIIGTAKAAVEGERSRPQPRFGGESGAELDAASVANFWWTTASDTVDSHWARVFTFTLRVCPDGPLQEDCALLGFRR